MKKILLLAFGLLTAVVLIGVIKFNFASALVPAVNIRISVNNSGDGQGGNDSAPIGSSFNLSADGRFVAFSSKATNFISNDTNGKSDIFLRDIDNNITSRVSVSSLGVEADGDSGLYGEGGQAISQTGRFIAFSSEATNLMDGQIVPGTYPQIYLRDMKTNTLSIVTQRQDGTLGNGVTASVHNVSNDGRFVLWEGTKNSNLNPNGGLASNAKYLYLTDMSDKSVSILTPHESGDAGSGGTYPAMSCDGSFVVATSKLPLDDDDIDGQTDVLLIDIRNNFKMKNITEASDVSAIRPSISCNGDYITFSSGDNVGTYTSLTPASQANNHLYRFDRIDESFTVIDTTTSGQLGNKGVSGPASIDNEGNIVFSSSATNFGIYATPHAQQFLKHKNTGQLELISRTGNYPASYGAVGKSSISIDGSRVVYTVGNMPSSLFGPIGTGDTNGKGDIVLSLTGL